jgi:hypothetical protein
MIFQVPVHEQNTTVWNVVQVAAAVVTAVILAAGRKLPAWLGFVFMLGASALAIAFGIIGNAHRFIPLGVACLIGTAVAWYSGASAKPEGDDDTLGGTADAIPWWAWAIIAVLFIVAIILSMVLA